MTYRAITGILEARTALHVGSGQSSDVADALLRRDTRGQPIIPGMAIAGAFRSLLTRLAPRIEGCNLCRALYPDAVLDALLPGARSQPCGCAVCRLMGDLVPSDGTGSAARASRLLVHNAVLISEDLRPMIRDGVGIDRVTGTAARAAAAKFDLEILPRGARFALRMELREPPDDDRDVEDEQLLIAGLSEWCAGRCYVGGDTSRGLGAFELKELSYTERDLDDKVGLMAFLKADEPWTLDEDSGASTNATQHLRERLHEIRVLDEDAAEAQAIGLLLRKCEDTVELPDINVPLARGWAQWTLDLRAEGPLLTHDPAVAGLNGFDHAPTLEALDDWQHPVLPGSGLRGVLRSQAERIARTLVTYKACAKGKEQAGRYFQDHCPACDPTASRGHNAKEGVVLESCDSLLRYEVKLNENQEVNHRNLCLACQLFGSTRNGSRLKVEDAPFCGDSPHYKMLDFLAIDRFTGGGAEHLKFDALALWNPSFSVRMVLENPEPWELGWLSLVVRDLAEGWLRVGFGAAKGFGKVVVRQGSLELAELRPGKPAAGGETLFHTRSWSLDDPDLQAEQVTWIAQFQKRLVDSDAFRRPQAMALPKDSYFDQRTERLYPPLGGEL